MRITAPQRAISHSGSRAKFPAHPYWRGTLSGRPWTPRALIRTVSTSPRARARAARRAECMTCASRSQRDGAARCRSDAARTRRAQARRPAVLLVDRKSGCLERARWVQGRDGATRGAGPESSDRVSTLTSRSPDESRNHAAAHTAVP